MNLGRHHAPSTRDSQFHWHANTGVTLSGVHTLFFISIYFWLCWVFAAACRRSLAVVSKGCSLVAICRLLIVVASLVAERRL